MDNDNGYKVIGFWILSFATIWLNKKKAKKKKKSQKTKKQNKKKQQSKNGMNIKGIKLCCRHRISGNAKCSIFCLLKHKKYFVIAIIQLTMVLATNHLYIDKVYY